MGVVALPANQQANFLQLHIRVAALRNLQALPLATSQNLELSITAPGDRFCTPHLQESSLLELEHLKLESKTETIENLLVMLLTKATKNYQDLDLLAVAPIDSHEVDAAADETLFCRDRARHAEKIRSAQEARAVQVRRQSIKKSLDGYL